VVIIEGGGKAIREKNGHEVNLVLKLMGWGVATQNLIGTANAIQLHSI